MWKLIEQADEEGGDDPDIRDTLLIELVVQECAKAIINDVRLDDVRSAANGCVVTIKKHFGIK